ncbi:MAG: glycerate kinase type-2 family protein [Gammaproteobacteria bacterium]
METSESRQQKLMKIWDAAIAAVSGRQAVLNALHADSPFLPDLIIAVGKAASGMCSGALERFPGCEALVVTKYEHTNQSLRARAGVDVIESAHPIPDQHSLDAGRALLARMRSMPEGSRVLMLVSGGASALAEALPEDMTLADLQAMTDDMIATGKTIAQINARRKQTSLIKDGKLIEAFEGEEIRVYAISDVEGDSIETIGSGIGDCCCAEAKASSKIIASNQIARQRAVHQAEQLGLEVHVNEETLYGDVFELAPVIGAGLQQAEPGVYIWGGEPTLVLPENPGRGGRNQSLALALAEYVSGMDNIDLLVAGTDGTDGPTRAAGGIVNGNTWSDPAAARAALRAADAGSYLERHRSLFVTGPTNTNVMDLVIAIVS